ncbi:Cobalt-zinc-cadmium resistance protein CzcA [Labilithrix luteola]|uniref:Cobalt-zinc-cadmium resistance protein CzcA n=1 Tax=Labilithrix luteola TaxID=1391654 RepID=A0A0K1Q3B5_9BACT|nr:CusA/CzcA family heavy metal efflux RND transporter [Labilithrix luteola]AKU99859.1 Cobalt-zinc-cadmium resistance protein CzcA [Labilithrix luteola]
MIERLVAWALRAPMIVMLLALGLVVAGAWSYKELDIEAYPNPVPPLVEIIAQPEGMSAEDVERYVTVPLEIGLAGMPGLEHTRSQSLFGLADVKCYFSWGTSYEAARQEVLNRLNMIQLPDGVQAGVSPWNAIGEVFRYELKGKGYSLRDLKTAQDWILERQFKQVPGVIDVVSFGGETKQYQVNVDPFRLRGYNVNLDQLIDAIQSSNQNVGGQRLTVGEQAYTIRGVGLVKNVHDIEAIVVAARGGVPIRVRDVATVELGFAPRLGIVGHDDNDDIVQGTVLMRYGGQTPKTLEGIHARVEHIRSAHLLPPGMEIVPYYDRGNLVALTTHTVLENVVVGMLLVTVILVLFLGHWRAALVTALNIPLALLFAFCGMVASDTPANLISIGAVDFGIVVDSTVIMMESIFHFLGKHGEGTIQDRILAGAKQVARPMAFSTIIIGIAFLPLFTMKGVSGVIFSPMAHTYAFAIGGAIFLALTLTPALASRVIPPSTEDKDSWATRGLKKLYWPIFRFAVMRPKTALVVSLLPVLFCLSLFNALGGEFMPKLEEGNLWIRATLPTSVSLEQSGKYVGRMRSILRGCPSGPQECTDKNRKYPEVLTVISQLGRPDDGTDVAGFHNIELFAPLKPTKEWRSGMTKARLTDELSRDLAEAFPGAVFNFSQMISDNVEEAMSGVKGENSIKVFGPDVADNEKIADQIGGVLDNVVGIRDLGIVRSSGQPSVKIVPDRQTCSRYGLNTGNVEAVIQAAIGGKAVTRVYEGDRTFDLTVRWLPPYRESLEAIKELMIFAPDGTPVPLAQIAQVTIEDSPSVIFREDGLRYTPLKFSVRGRDLESTVAEAQQRVAATVKTGYDTHLEWSGEINELREAQARLALIVPATLILIALLVYGSVRNFWATLIVLCNIPVACAGGILALFLARLNFSVSAAMGFISIFGIAIQDAMLVVSYFLRLRAEGESIQSAALDASMSRLRAVLMTTLVAMFGLLPAALSHGIGSETQKPLAVVVIGGAMMLAVAARVVQPPLLVLVHGALERFERRREVRRQSRAALNEKSSDDPQQATG